MSGHALVAAVAASGLGAVVLCGLVVLYGFTPADEVTPEKATRRLFLTRGGHGVAAVCFAATAILIAIVLVRPASAPPPVSSPVADHRVPALREMIAGQEGRLSETETRLQELERTQSQREAESPRESAVPARSREVVSRPAGRVRLHRRHGLSAGRVSSSRASCERTGERSSGAPTRRATTSAPRSTI